jgi:hypothetical protein
MEGCFLSSVRFASEVTSRAVGHSRRFIPANQRGSWILPSPSVCRSRRIPFPNRLRAPGDSAWRSGAGSRRTRCDCLQESLVEAGRHPHSCRANTTSDRLRGRPDHICKADSDASPTTQSRHFRVTGAESGSSLETRFRYDFHDPPPCYSSESNRSGFQAAHVLGHRDLSN